MKIDQEDWSETFNILAHPNLYHEKALFNFYPTNCKQVPASSLKRFMKNFKCFINIEKQVLDKSETTFQTTAVSNSSADPS